MESDEVAETAFEVEETVDAEQQQEQDEEQEEVPIEERADEVEEQVEEFALKQGRSRVAHKKWNERAKELLDFQEEVGDDVTEYAQYLLNEEDQPFIAEIQQYAEDFDESTGRKMKRRIFKMFDKVFEDIRSRSYEVHDPDDERYSITVGPYGFGIRPATQAKEVTRWSGVAKLLPYKDEIAAGIRRELGLRDSERWAERWEKFASLIPEDFSEDVVSVELDEAVVAPYTNRSLGNNMMPRLIQEMDVNTDGFRVYGENEEIGDNPLGRKEWKIPFDGNAYSLNRDDAFIYVQLSPQIASLHEQYVERVEPTIEETNSIIEDLEDEFGQDLLLANI